MISKSFGNINNKCTGKTKLKHSTTYRNGSIQRFLSRAYKLCTEKYLQSETDFLIDISQ